jgi:hypothetical protein
MKHKITGVVSVAAAAVLWSASAQAQDLKITNGAACTPVVAETGVPSSSNVVTPSGGRFSTQPGASVTAPRPPLMFVCPLTRDDLDGTFPVEVSLRVNTFNALSMPGTDFTCNLKIVDQQGNVVDQTGDIIIGVGFGSKVLSAGEWALSVEHAYVLTCIVPNVTFGQRSGIFSYKWSEKSF